MNALLDTHVLIWLLTGSRRLAELPWLERYRPWGVSPVSLLELAFLDEVGRVEADVPALAGALAGDPRFVLDDPPLAALVHRALGLSWTRDPFDRLLAAHSRLRRVPLVTLDRTLRRHHALLPEELTGSG